jgi:hypothetical protein
VHHEKRHPKATNVTAQLGATNILDECAFQRQSPAADQPLGSALRDRAVGEAS